MRRVWLTLAVLVVALLALGAAVAVLLQQRLGGAVRVASPAVLEIDLEGSVVEKFHPDPFVAGLEGARYQLADIVRGISAATEDDRVRGIYLRVGLPGYGWAKAEEIRERLREFRRRGKFVYAYASPTDELGYYVALAAERIWLLPDTGLELNGFRVETPFILRLFEKLGLEAQVESIGAYKTAADMLRRDNMSDEEREVTEGILRERYDRFVSEVVERRGVDRAAFSLAFDRGLYLARELRDLGLIDGELYEPEVRALALQAARGEPHPEAARGEPDSEAARGEPDPEAARGEPGPEGPSSGASPQRGRTEGGPARRVQAGEPLGPEDLEHFIRLEDYVATLPPPDRGRGRAVALVYAVGVIARGDDTVDPVFGRTMGAASTVEMLREVAADERVEAVVLRVDSPGGDAWASEEIWAQVEELKRSMPVVVSMSDVAGSGGYYIAAGADAIVAAPSTITGSIGVLGVVFNAAEAWDKLGIRWATVKTNEAADFPTTTRPLTEAERETFRAVIADIYRNFVSRVALGRERPVAEIDALAQGRIWSGAQAHERGLVDRVGGLAEAVQAARELAGIPAEERVGIVLYPKDKTFFERLFSLARARGTASLPVATRSTGASQAWPGGYTSGLDGAAALLVAREVRQGLTGLVVALREGPARPLTVMPFVPRIR